MPTPVRHRACERCGETTCINLAYCWPCFQIRNNRETRARAEFRHLGNCANCNGGHTEPPLDEPMEDEEEHQQSMGTPAKLSTSAYVDAYGLRVPAKTTIGDIRNIWAMAIPYVSYDIIRGVTSRSTTLKAYNVKGQIIPKENLTNLHNQLVRHAKAKPMSHQEPAIPDYTSEPDYSLLKLIGVEFEGGWYLDRVRSGHLRIKRDGSVNVSNRHPVRNSETDLQEVCSDPDCDWQGCIAARAAAAQAPSEPVNVRQRLGFSVGELEFGPWPAQSFATDWEGVFDNCYPEEVNESCGQHVHISFPSTGIYGAFVRQDFRPWLMGGLKNWVERDHANGGAIPAGWPTRLSGRNQYCQATYEPGMVWGQGDRYSQVNFCHRKHGTMEVRVLPMFETPAQSKAAIAELVRLVAIWANAFAPRPRKPILIGEAELDGESASVEATVTSPSSPASRWANFDPMAPIECPVCGHDINACRGYAASRGRGNWDGLRSTMNDWNRGRYSPTIRNAGNPVGCCASGGNTHYRQIAPDSLYAQTLMAIFNGEIA
jgi:hypothetical protein